MHGQSDSVFHLDSLPLAVEGTYADPGIPINQSWKYHKGDDPNWASPDFDDREWVYQRSSLNLPALPENFFDGIAWFRMRLMVDTTLLNKTLGLMVTHFGASEIYVDGKLIHSFGKINTADLSLEEREDPQEIPVDIRFENQKEHLIAVRYADSKAVENYRKNILNVAGFEMKIGPLKDSVFYKNMNSNITTTIFVFYFTFFLALSFLHFMFYIFYRTNRSNLYYSIFAGAFGTIFLFITIQKGFTSSDAILITHRLFGFLPDFYIPALLAMLYSIFYYKLPKIFWLWMLLFVADFIATLFNAEIPTFGILLNAIFVIESLRIIIWAIIKKREGSWIIGSGIIITVLFFALFAILASMGTISFSAQSGWAGFFVGLMVIYATLSIPISMTIYLARDFAKTSKNLSKKLVEVEELSAKSIEQEKEKQRILSSQNELLEVQVKERTSEIEEQKKLIEEKNKDITDSINYAKRIQEAMLPQKSDLENLFKDSFVLFKPKDIVSGDFYWFTELGDKKIVVAADCTGHGVPGALMSMIGSNILNKLILEKGIVKPDLILNELNEEVRTALKQRETASETRDGMDISVLTFSGNTVQYAGAHRPLYLIKSGSDELIEVKADKFSIGGIQEEKRSFTNHVLTLQPNDLLYLSSDGYADQFGGTSGKKLMTKHFKELLLKIKNEPLRKQSEVLASSIETWKGMREQVDDILVIGIRL